MRTTRLSQSEIVYTVKQVEMGIPVRAIARRCGVSEKTVYQRGIQLDLIAPVRSAENGLIESFNGQLRDERLSMHWFESPAAAGGEIEAWRRGTMKRDRTPA